MNKLIISLFFIITLVNANEVDESIDSEPIYAQNNVENSSPLASISERITKEQLIALGVYCHLPKFTKSRFEQIQLFHARQIGPEFTKLVEKYGLTEEMLQLVAHHQNRPENFTPHTSPRSISPSLIPQSNNYTEDVESRLELPKSRIYDKGNNLSRIFNAIRMKECIKKHNLYLLDVAQKHIGYTQRTWRVFVKETNKLDKNKKISLELIKQILKLREETGYQDWRNPGQFNWLWDANTGKLTCIDTEDNAFSPFTTDTFEMWEKEMDTLALLYLKLYFLIKPNHTPTVLLPFNSLYDPADINITKVREEYKQYINKKNLSVFLKGAHSNNTQNKRN